MYEVWSAPAGKAHIPFLGAQRDSVQSVGMESPSPNRKYIHTHIYVHLCTHIHTKHTGMSACKTTKTESWGDREENTQGRNAETKGMPNKRERERVAMRERKQHRERGNQYNVKKAREEERDAPTWRDRENGQRSLSLRRPYTLTARGQEERPNSTQYQAIYVHKKGQAQEQPARILVYGRWE